MPVTDRTVAVNCRGGGAGIETAEVVVIADLVKMIVIDDPSGYEVSFVFDLGAY